MIRYTIDDLELQLDCGMSFVRANEIMSHLPTPSRPRPKPFTNIGKQFRSWYMKDKNV